MAFLKTFDELLNAILTDLQTQAPGCDVSRGSLLFVKSSALASALWGLYKEGQYVEFQRFADTCDRETLDHYVTVRGMTIIPGETDAALRARVLDDIRHPPAGGNKYDYPRWAKEASTDVQGAWCVPLGQGPGTVDVVITAKAATGSEIPDADLLATVRAYIVDICPTDIKFLRVLAPEPLPVNVTIDRAGSDYPAASAIADITAYLAGFTPGQPLYLDQLKALALGGSEGAAPVTLPVADVTPTAYQMIRPGVINVT
jgi:uncharacterized phage protein gp47/JayE